MALVPKVKRYFYAESMQFRGATSEELFQRVGASVNFLNDTQYDKKDFFINGRYDAVPVPFYGVDGLGFFEFDSEIFNVWMFVKNAGTSGTVELDIKINAGTSGSGFASIFSTTPKIASSAGNYAIIKIGGSGTGLTAPVLSTINVNAGQAIRCDILQAQAGASITGCGIVVHYRAR